MEAVVVEEQEQEGRRRTRHSSAAPLPEGRAAAEEEAAVEAQADDGLPDVPEGAPVVAEEDYSKGMTFDDFSDLLEDLSVNAALDPVQARLSHVRIAA